MEKFKKCLQEDNLTIRHTATWLDFYHAVWDKHLDKYLKMLDGPSKRGRRSRAELEAEKKEDKEFRRDLRSVKKQLLEYLKECEKCPDVTFCLNLHILSKIDLLVSQKS